MIVIAFFVAFCLVLFGYAIALAVNDEWFLLCAMGVLIGLAYACVEGSDN